MRGARHNFDPGMRDGNERLAQIFIGKPDRLEHGAGRRPRRSINQHAAIRSKRIVVISHIEITAARNIEVRLMICTTARAPSEMAPPRSSLPALHIGVTFSLSGRPLSSDG